MPSMPMRIKKWLLNDLVDASLDEQSAAMSAWFDSPPGQALLEQEQQAIDQILPPLFGYHLMQMGLHGVLDANGGLELSRASAIHHRFHLRPGLSAAGRHMAADYEALPFENDSIDVIILHHVLEFAPNPHQILREVNRVLIPRGHVIIVGFNPFSLWGLWKAGASLFGSKVQWRYNSITKWRLQDWFKLIDLGKLSIRDVFYRPPVLLNKLNILERIGAQLHLPTGASYTMLARKDVNAMIPIKPSLRAQWEGRLPKALPGFSPRPAPQPAAQLKPGVSHHKNKHWLH